MYAKELTLYQHGLAQGNVSADQQGVCGGGTFLLRHDPEQLSWRRAVSMTEWQVEDQRL